MVFKRPLVLPGEIWSFLLWERGSSMLERCGAVRRFIYGHGALKWRCGRVDQINCITEEALACPPHGPCDLRLSGWLESRFSIWGGVGEGERKPTLLGGDGVSRVSPLLGDGYEPPRRAVARLRNWSKVSWHPAAPQTNTLHTTLNTSLVSIRSSYCVHSEGPLSTVVYSEPPTELHIWRYRK